MPRICLFTGSFNPPGLHHRAAAIELAKLFDAVHVIPCGYRPDKPNHDAIPPVLRAALADLGFAGLDRVRVDHFDLEQAAFTTNADLDCRFECQGETWHTVWADKLEGGRDGESEVQRHWKDGPRVWETLRFAVLQTPDMDLDPADLPPKHQVVRVPRSGSSREIRFMLFSGQTAADQLEPRVLDYIQRYSLFTLGPPRTTAALDLAGKKLKIVADTWNADALRRQESLSHLRDDEHPDAILVLGGDGTMLRAIRENWALRVPFIGLNFGHLGFLMNESDEVAPDSRTAGKLLVRRLPMLNIVMTRRDGSKVEELCFNDAWVERSTGQTAWLRLSLNGEVRLEKVVCDGMLVSTAAGSTAYALSMGASPLLADTPAWLVVGSNVMRPLGWKSALLPMDAVVKIENAAPERRPLNGFIFNNRYDDVLAMEARVSRVASVELAFSEKHDMARKISDLQFGSIKAI